MAVLRSTGARPGHVFLLLCIESTVLTAGGIIAGLFFHYALTGIGSMYLQQRFGLSLPLTLPESGDITILLYVALSGVIAGTLPALQAYRKSLADGLSQRI